MKSKITILLLTVNRFHQTRKYVGDALANAGIEYDLCITDNGSTDPEIIQWAKEQNPALLIHNSENMGVPQSLNKMIRMHQSDYYCFIGNDIELPDNWLKELYETYSSIPESGIAGIDWRGGIDADPVEMNSKTIDLCGRCFGTAFFSKELINDLGKLCEDYGVYGLWDSDFSIRTKLTGRLTYYLHGMKSTHMGNDVGETSPYRKMKDDSLLIGKPIFDRNVENYRETGIVKIY